MSSENKMFINKDNIYDIVDRLCARVLVLECRSSTALERLDFFERRLARLWYFLVNRSLSLPQPQSPVYDPDHDYQRDPDPNLS